MTQLKQFQKSTLQKLAKRLIKYRFRLICSLLLACVIVGTTLYLPILTGRGVDTIAAAGRVDFAALYPILVSMAGVMGVTAVCQWAMTAINNSIAYHMVQDIRNAAFEKLMRLPISYVDDHSHGELLNRIINDVDQFSEGLLMGFAQFFTGVLTILLTLCIMFTISPVVTLVVLLVTPLAMVVAGFIAKKSYIYFRSQSEKRAKMTGIVEEMIGGISTVQAFLAEKAVGQDFDTADEEFRSASQNAVFFSSIAFPSTRFVNSLVYGGVGLSGALLAIAGGISVGQLVSVLSYATQYTKPFNEISGVVTELQNSFACAARVFDLMEEAEIIPDGEDALALEHVQGRVCLEEVSFSYDKAKTLIEDLNLKVEKGQRVAIVGPTGSGKSTIINLLMRFYEVDRGSILVEGINIQNVVRKSLRQSFGMVLQETWLKSGTIRDNIAMGKPEASLEEVMEAARESYAHNFIQRMPQGYDTLVQEGGENLSAGQRQLLCITRVMLSLPPMLILDEATSSIDTMTEARISQAFDKMMQGRTSFVVAHRLSTIKNADVILVLKEGQIIEQGSHGELLSKKGFYYDLYMSQFAPAS